MKIEDIASRNFDPLDPGRLAEVLESKWTITAAPDESALELARKVDEGSVDVIVVMTSPAQPLGIVAPRRLKENLREHLGIRESSFELALRAFEADPEERRRDFAHEWVRSERVDLGWCEPGKHYTVRPCGRH